MKHARVIFKRLRDEFPGLEITRLRQRTHLIFALRLGETTRHLAVASTPKNVDHTISNAIKEARRLLAHAPH